MKLKSILAAVVILILPLFFTPGVFLDEIRTGKVALLFIVSTGVGSYLIKRSYGLPLSLNFYWCCISAAISGLGLQFQLAGVALLSSAVLSSYLVTGLNRYEISRILKALVHVGVISAAMGYLQVLGHDPVFMYRPNVNHFIPTGFLGQQTLFGPFIAACLTAALFRRDYIFALFMIPMVYATQSSFTFLSAICGVSVFICFRFGWRAFSSLLGGSLVGLYFFRSETNWADLLNPQGRVEIWKALITATWEKHPLVGLGFGTYSAYIEQIQSEPSKALNGVYVQAHSDYIQHFFETGIIGILLFFWMIFDFIKKLWENRGNEVIMCLGAIVLVFLVNAGGNFPFRVVPQGLLALWAYIMIVTFKVESYDSNPGTIHRR